MSSCSVVMVSFHTGPVLFAAVKAVLRQQGLAELIVVDNGNPPHALARLQQMTLGEPRLKILTGHGNIGLARGCNLGSRQATGEFLLLLNPDCLLPTDALLMTMAAFDEIPGAMVAGCRISHADGTEQEDGCRLTPLTPKTALVETLTLRKYLPHAHPVVGMQTQEVASIASVYMCVRRNDYNRLMGLDEAFFLQIEGYDFCMRVRKLGGKVICVPRVRVTHMHATGARGITRFVEWQKARGYIHYFHKHFRGQYVPGTLLLIDLAILGYFTLKMLLVGLANLFRRRPLMVQTVPAKRLMILASGLTELAETNELEGRVVIVTGATHHIGLCVLRRMLAAGASVLAVSRMDAIPFEHERLRWIKGDLTDESLHLQGYLADVIVHCAPLSTLPPALNLLAEAEVQRVIAFSSTSIYAKATSKNDEEKALVEELTRGESEIAEGCRQKNMRFTILRPTMIYGVGLDMNITTLIKFIWRFGFFIVFPPAFGRRQPVHADDLALAVMQAMNNPQTHGKTYNLSGGEILTYREMVERLFKLLKKPIRIYESTALPYMLSVLGLFVRQPPINADMARRMNDDLIFFHDEAKKDFGFTPRLFLSGGMRDIEGF